MFRRVKCVSCLILSTVFSVFCFRIDCGIPTTKATRATFSCGALCGVKMKKDNDPDVNNINDLPSGDGRCIYRFCTYKYIDDEINRMLNPTDRGGGGGLAPGTLVWILRGRRKTKKKRQQEQQPNKNNQNQDLRKEDCDDAYDDVEVQRRPSQKQQKHQRMVLFNRAWVVCDPKYQQEEHIANEETHQHQHEKVINGDDGDDRILVQYPFGSTYRVRRLNVLPVVDMELSTHCVVVVKDTPVYRRFSVVHTRPDDSFVEIGCDYGYLVSRIQHYRCDEYCRIPTTKVEVVVDEQETTKKVSVDLNKGCSDENFNGQNSESKEGASTISASTTMVKQQPCLVIGLDTCHASIVEARKRYPGCNFRQWRVPLDDVNDPSHNVSAESLPLPDDLFGPLCSIAATATTPAPSKNPPVSSGRKLVVAIDINGNRPLEMVQKCIDIVIREWQPRMIVVKSIQLYKLLDCGPIEKCSIN